MQTLGTRAALQTRSRGSCGTSQRVPPHGPRSGLRGSSKMPGPQAHPTPMQQSPRPPPVPLTVLESAPHVGMVIVPATWAPGLGSPLNPAASLSVWGGGGPFPVVRMFITGVCLCSPLVLL